MKVFVLITYETDGWESTDVVEGVFATEEMADIAGDKFIDENPDTQFMSYGYYTKELELQQ